jgi:ribosomal protein S18 acetylase RimI-like enzyme
MTDLSIRAATPDDVPRLTDLWQQQHDIIRQLDPRYTAGQPAAAVANMIQKDNAHVYIASRADGLILGYISGRIEPPHVEQLVIDAHVGSGGVGTALLNTLTNAFRANGSTAYTVAVPRHHAVQQAFWRAKGAAVVAIDNANRTETMQIHIKGGN